LTFTPDTTDPVLSVTVPEKLPVAWPYRSGQMGNTSEQNSPSSSFLVVIKFPLGASASIGDAAGRFPTKFGNFSTQLDTTMHPDVKSFQDFLRPGIMSFSN
jgi:hypothetical protein